MYVPSAFRWSDEGAALNLAREFNFALLITVAGATPMVTHLPVLIDPDRRVLRGHVARANPHSAHLEREHLAVFTGPHAYISPDWYGDDGSDAPTWNYAAVHIQGTGRTVTDPHEVEEFLVELSAFEERRRSDLGMEGSVWTMDKIPAGELERMRRAILAFEIDIDRIEAKAKLSQNKPAPVVRAVAERLALSASSSAQNLASLMAHAKWARKE